MRRPARFLALTAACAFAACGRAPAPAPATSAAPLPPAPSGATESVRLVAAELEWTGAVDLDLEIWSDTAIPFYIREAVSKESDVKTGAAGRERLEFDGDVGSGSFLLGVGWWDGPAETAAARLTLFRSDSTTAVQEGELDREAARFWMAARVRPEAAAVEKVDRYFDRPTRGRGPTAR